MIKQQHIGFHQNELDTISIFLHTPHPLNTGLKRLVTTADSTTELNHIYYNLKQKLKITLMR